MGERYLTDLAEVCRRTGRPVYEGDGWQYRARGSGGYDDGRPNHVMVHHTASGPGSDGWPDVNYCTYGDDDAPLCNLYLDRAGAIYVCAGGATNTNGSGSDPCGLTADDSMNSSAIGIEAGNDGIGERWPDAQLDAYLALVGELEAAYGIGSAQCHAHFEWAPSRKTDPAGPDRYALGSASWGMDAFRADVGAAPAPPDPSEDDMTTPASIWLGGGRLDYFMVGTDRAVYHCWWDVPAGGAWSAWENLGGQITSNLTVTGEGDNGAPVRIDVSGMGTDGNIWHRWFDQGAGWSGWEPISPQPPC
jgi:hypothetical protein